MGNFSAAPTMFRGVVVPQGVAAGGGIALVSRWLFRYPHIDTGIDGLIRAYSTYGTGLFREIFQNTEADRPDVIDPHVEMGVPGITGDNTDYLVMAATEVDKYSFLHQPGDGATVVLAFRRKGAGPGSRSLLKTWNEGAAPGINVLLSDTQLIIRHHDDAGNIEASIVLTMPGNEADGGNFIVVVRWNGVDEINANLDGIGGTASGTDSVPSPGEGNSLDFLVGNTSGSGLESTYMAGLEIYNKNMGASFINTAKLQWANRGMDFNPWLMGTTTADSGLADVTSLAVDLPTVPGGIQAGDLIVVCCSCGDDGGGANLVDTPAWADGELLSDLSVGGPPPSAPTTTIFYEIANGGETGTRTFTVGTAERLGAICFVVRGINTSNVLDVATTTATGDSADPDPPNITTVSARTMVIAFMHGDGDDGALITGIPSGYNQIAIQQVTSGGASSTSIAVAFKVLAAAGAENPGVFTRTTEQWGAATIALRVAT